MRINEPGTRTGKYGYRVTIKRVRKGKPAEILYQRTHEDMIMANQPTPEKTASVGLSVSIGGNTDFGKEKIEVAAWCTLPSTPDDAGIAETYERCALITMDEVRRRLDEASDMFFPGTA